MTAPGSQLALVYAFYAGVLGGGEACSYPPTRSLDQEACKKKKGGGTENGDLGPKSREGLVEKRFFCLAVFSLLKMVCCEVQFVVCGSDLLV